MARSFSGDTEHLVGLIKSGIQHRGCALIDILQPCVSFNHKNTRARYKERVYKLEKALERGDRIPTSASSTGRKGPL